MTHRLHAGQHANISGKVCRLEDGLIVSPEVQVDHQSLQSLRDDPGLVFSVPAGRRRTSLSYDAVTLSSPT